MKKHLSYIIIAILLVLCLVPTTVMAEDPEPSTSGPTYFEATSINFVVEPILGNNVLGLTYESYSMTPAMDSTIRHFNVSDTIWFKISDADYENYKNDIETARTKMEKIDEIDEVFQDGYHYYVCFLSQAYEKEGEEVKDNLPFNENISATINGNEADVLLMEDGYCLSVEAYVDVLGIHNIDMTITAPALDAQADYEPSKTITDDVCDEEAGLGVVTVDTKWYKVAEDDYDGVEDSTWVEMEEDEKYTTGYYYMAKFDANVSNNKEYLKLYRTISKNLTGKLNNKDFDKIEVADDQYSAVLYKCFNPLTEPTPAPIEEYTPPETGVYGPEDNSINNNFLWVTLLLVSGGVATAVLANKKGKYNR